MAACLGLAASACARLPPLAPGVSASIGWPHRGALIGGAELPKDGDGYRFLRDNDRRFALPRFSAAIARAAKAVADARPGGVLAIGDLSAPRGGPILPHLSHRSGRDADLLLYVTTLDGAPVPSPGFVHVQADGLAWDDAGKRFYRLDVEREWLLVKALLEDEQARVQWVFVSDVVRAMLLDWARARGEGTETLYRAVTVMAQPRPGGVHDDHVHVRTACTAEEMASGCEAFGPERPWLVPAGSPAADTDADLLRAILLPLDDGRVGSR